MSAAGPVSVIVLAGERPERLDELYREYSAPLQAAGIAHEFVFLLEPSAEGLGDQLAPLVASGAPVRRLQFAQQVPESAMARLAAEEAKYDTLLFMPAYRRVVAESLPRLLDQLREGADLALASRRPRRDPGVNRLQGRLFHAVLNRISRQRFEDVGSGVMAVSRGVVAELPLYGEFFRFLPVLAAREGFRVAEVPAAQHQADQQLRVYSAGTYVRRMVDLLGLFFLVRFTDRPLRFFGLVGTVLGLAGGVILLVLFVQRIEGTGIANRPMLLLGLLLLVLGIQAVALGLVAEIIVHLGAPRRRGYRLRGPGASAS